MYPRLFLFLFLPLVVLLNVCNYDRLYQHPHYEEGDDAANALQVYKAKSFRELHGNYSRFSFNHPGPGFFYAYALAESVLYDHAKVVATPRAAHLWMTVVMQSAFLCAAIALIAARTRQPYLFGLLCLGLAALHFGHATGAFYSNWPPHVLLMPFLCLLVAATVTSLGRGDGLFTLVLSACFLIHGHVAQPLFVLPIVAVAITLLIQNRRRAGEPSFQRRDTATWFVTGLFVLPLVLDLFSGPQNNAYRILLHLTHQSSEGPSFYASLLCYLSYFVYSSDQTVFNRLTPDSYALFVSRWPLLAGWLLATLGAMIWAFRNRKRDGSGQAAWRLTMFYVLGVVLTLIWGMRQDGGLTPFNSFLNFALIFVPIIIGLFGIIPKLSQFPLRWSLGIAGGLAFVSIVAFLSMPLPGDDRGNAVNQNLPALLAADPVKDSAKLLENGFVDGDWYETVTLARALQRNQVPFFTHPAWRVMFGEDKVFENQGHLLENDRISLWQVVRRDRVPTAVPITSDFGIHFPTPNSLGPLPARIDFGAQGNHDTFARFGICRRDPDSEWVWTEAKVAYLEFTSPPVQDDIVVEFVASGFAHRKDAPYQRVGFIVNGERLATWEVLERRTFTTRIPAAVWNRRSPLRVVLDLPDAIVPATLYGNGDRRQLGVGIYSLTFSLAGDRSHPGNSQQ